MIDFEGKSILVTGGTGSFGKIFIKHVFENHPDLKRLVVLSRDEQKHYQMQMEFSDKKYEKIEYFIGDVRDVNRLNRVFKDIDIVIHAAAMKHVHIAENNPIECIKTNILGAENIIEAALNNNVEKVIALSSDKASKPISLYGATKLASDKLFIAANNIHKEGNTIFSVVRYGNVMGANGSVIPFFLRKKAEGVLPITDKRMTRFTITPEDSCMMVFKAIETAIGGEIFIPKSPSYRITDVAKAIGPDCVQEVIGLRLGEKIHEEMFSISESLNTYDLGAYFVLIPNIEGFDLEKFLSNNDAKKVPEGFSYSSEKNDEWLTVDEIRELVLKHNF